MKISVSFHGASLSQLASEFEGLGHEARVQGAKELNKAGAAMRTGLIGILAKQTGLKRATLSKALKESRAEAADPVYELLAGGGDIALKYFGAKETPGGVMAKPWGVWHLFEHKFMKAGGFPNRVTRPNWNGQVFERTGGKTMYGKDKLKKVKSGLFLGEELVKGQSLAFFELTTARMGASIARAVLPQIP